MSLLNHTFLSLVLSQLTQGSYKSYYLQKRTEVGGLSDRMNMGLNKLVEASKSVAVLQEELVVKEKDLAVASKAADAVLADVTAGTIAAEKVKDSVLKVKTKSEGSIF
jgi:dynein heavy chain, axonemal